MKDRRRQKGIQRSGELERGGESGKKGDYESQLQKEVGGGEKAVLITSRFAASLTLLRFQGQSPGLI